MAIIFGDRRSVRQRPIKKDFKLKMPNRKLEEHLQIQCVQWAKIQYPAIAQLFFHIPNSLKFLGGIRGVWINELKQLKRKGLTKGVLDLFLSVPRGIYPGAYFELKADDNELTPEQKTFKTLAMQQGYKVFEIRDFYFFKKCFDDYLKLPSSWITTR